MTIQTRFEDGVGTLTLCRPPLNILTRALLAELRDALQHMAREHDLRVLVLAAEGRHFSAGADVAEHLPPQFRELIPEFIATVQRVAEFPAPVVAAVRGKCLGGAFEVVQAADIVVAGESASFGQPEILLGVSPPAACALLPELCAPGLAAELVLTGEAIGARQALESGLVRRVVPDDAVESEARDLARRMARHSGAALRLTKRALRSGLAARRAAALAAAAAVYVDELMQSEDAVEGLQAFLEKRQPVWKHR
jgi:cyclohexa-1,5-dienecarbonyl-CoA hydratase